MTLASVVHKHRAPPRPQPIVRPERKVDPPVVLRIVDRNIRPQSMLREALGQGEIVCARPGRGADPVAARAQADHWTPFRLWHHHPVRDRADLFRCRVPLDPGLKARGQAIGPRKPPPRPLKVDIDESAAERPSLVDLPRTEEAAFAGSSGSRGDLDRRLRRSLASPRDCGSRQRRTNQPAHTPHRNAASRRASGLADSGGQHPSILTRMREASFALSDSRRSQPAANSSKIATSVPPTSGAML